MDGNLQYAQNGVKFKRLTERQKNALLLTSGFTQAGAQLVRHFVSNSCFRLSSEPLQYPRLREAAATLSASGGQRSGITKTDKKSIVLI